MSPSVSLWKTAQHRQDYLSRWLIKLRTQYNTKTGPQMFGAYYDVSVSVRPQQPTSYAVHMQYHSCGVWTCQQDIWDYSFYA